MSTTYTTASAAAALGASVRTVQRHCQQHAIGQRHGRDWQISAADLDRLAKIFQGGPGNPAMTAGNYFAGAKKRRKARENKG